MPPRMTSRRTLALFLLLALGCGRTPPQTVMLTPQVGLLGGELAGAGEHRVAWLDTLAGRDCAWLALTNLSAEPISSIHLTDGDDDFIRSLAGREAGVIDRFDLLPGERLVILANAEPGAARPELRALAYWDLLAWRGTQQDDESGRSTWSPIRRVVLPEVDTVRVPVLDLHLSAPLPHTAVRVDWERGAEGPEGDEDAEIDSLRCWFSLDGQMWAGVTAQRLAQASRRGADLSVSLAGRSAFALRLGPIDGPGRLTALRIERECAMPGRLPGTSNRWLQVAFEGSPLARLRLEISTVP
jgi:hypothetical protein